MEKQGGRLGTVQLLWFVQERKGLADIELLIGVYETEPDARDAIGRLKDKPGFARFPQGLQIHSRELGRETWTEGFISDD